MILSVFRTPLMHAVSNGHVDTVLYLIANGAIVNNRDIQGRTALHRGVSSCNLKIIEKIHQYVSIVF